MKATLACALMVGATALSGASAPAEDRGPTTISEIRHESSDRSTRIAVECTGPVAYTYYSPDPLTLVVDIPEVDSSSVPSRINVATREVESIRVSANARGDGRNLARLEIRLASLVPFQIYSKDKTLNLVFERAPEAAAAQAAQAGAEVATVAPAPEAPAAATPAAAEPVPAPATIVAAPAPAGKRASRILSVVPGDEDGQFAVTVKADGALKYQDFFLGNPDRLVLDFKDVTSKAMRPVEVNREPVRAVRLGQFSVASPRIARLVLDLSSRAPYRIVEGADGMKIIFGEGETPRPAPLAALRNEAETVVQSDAAGAAAPPAIILPAPAPEPMPAPVTDPLQEPAQRPVEFEPITVTAQEKQFTGHPISLDFKDGDLQDIFRLFADISGLNIVVNPGVTGKVTLKLNEVPWDQALDLILKANNLGYTLENNVIRIAPLAALQREEQERRKLAEERALAGDLQVWSKRLSYAKAQDLSATVKTVALSARGTITLDPRTNTMIITDLPVNIERAKDLITDLDRATSQVEIEARIVVTSRNFTRDLGIQWGFLNRQTPQFNTTTNLAFPNAIVLNGQGVPSTGGIPADQTGLASGAGIGTTGRGYAVNLPATAFNTGIGISLGNILGSFNLDLALTALERQGRGRLLSTPKVTTQNNQSAEIKQGVQIPIQTVANNTVTVSFKDAVLTLKVTPQITEAGTVILTVEVENNSADFANLVNGIPPINTQSAKTQVLVRDGATAVIGGIYQSNEQTSQGRTPFLANVPFLGNLFRNRFITNTNNELLLFITPRIIRG
jgi:type IV pilus secretin PilQ/predicted competence protein